MRTLSGWGRYPRLPCEVAEPRDEAGVRAALEGFGHVIARGNGRSYGDSALGRRGTVVMRGLERLIDFDEESGLLTCEAGTLLSDIVSVFLPRGWFVPVTPGTRFVTVGGMIAADVHGKNHHVAGSFGRHVAWLDLMLADGRVVRCSSQENRDLFAATLGGMGLTGLILRAAFPLMRVETPFIKQETHKAANLAEAMEIFEATASSTYSVAWIDCVARGDRLGRSLVLLGEHLTRAEAPADLPIPPAIAARPRFSVPLDFPGIALNRWSVRAFNHFHYRRGRPGTAIVPLEPYFYPLDAIGGWNRIYGRRGFLQYQFVLPKPASREGMARILRRIADHGSASFLAVLKLFGPQDGLLSFPMEGYTLALDLPASIANLNLLQELDAMVEDYGGRLYLAKDARTSPASLRRGYPALSRFLEVRNRVDPGHRFRSVQSERLAL
ncbi:MAG: FAD-binding oxidoreductase [Alsobacter sp.]